jgi:hypothetical protein
MPESKTLNYKVLMSKAWLDSSMVMRYGSPVAIVHCEVCNSSFEGFSDHRGAKEYTATVDAMDSLAEHLRRFHSNILGD